MATVHHLALGPVSPTLSDAVAAFCDTLDTPGTRRAYTGTLRALLAHAGPLMPVATLGEPPAVATITAWQGNCITSQALKPARIERK
jgi:hypothetical protein